MKINEILLINGGFSNDRETGRLPYTNQFDGQHLQFTSLNGAIKNVQFVKDSITADLAVTGKERSGLDVKKLEAKMKMSPDIMEFSNLALETSKSKIGNYFAMHYNNFVGDMNQFISNVVLEGNFENTELNSDDLAIFAPVTKNWKRVFSIKGNSKGSIDNISAKNMLIKSGHTIVDGDIALRGLPDIKTTFIDFKSNDLQTNYSELITLVPVLRYVTQPNLAKLGNIRFKGNFTGFITDFVAFGNINTSLGNIRADINMKLPENRAATYSGKISSAGFNLGQFVNNNSLGNIALDGKINGSGFKLKDLDANFDGQIHRLDYSGYSYQNITVKGTFQKSLFNGLFAINDPNLIIEKGNGTISLSGEKTQFNFDAVLLHSNLRQLRITNQDFSVTGHFKLNFIGNNIDNFLGTARVYDATLFHDSTRLSFDSLSISSFMENGNKVLNVQSNEIEGTLTGQFKILELPDAFKCS